MNAFPFLSPLIKIPIFPSCHHSLIIISAARVLYNLYVFLKHVSCGGKKTLVFMLTFYEVEPDIVSYVGKVREDLII